MDINSISAFSASYLFSTSAAPRTGIEGSYLLK